MAISCNKQQATWVCIWSTAMIVVLVLYSAIVYTRIAEIETWAKPIVTSPNQMDPHAFPRHTPEEAVVAILAPKPTKTRRTILQTTIASLSPSRVVDSSTQTVTPTTATTQAPTAMPTVATNAPTYPQQETGSPTTSTQEVFQQSSTTAVPTEQNQLFSFDPPDMSTLGAFRVATGLVVAPPLLNVILLPYWRPALRGNQGLGREGLPLLQFLAWPGRVAFILLGLFVGGFSFAENQELEQAKPKFTTVRFLLASLVLLVLGGAELTTSTWRYCCGGQGTTAAKPVKFDDGLQEFDLDAEDQELQSDSDSASPPRPKTSIRRDEFDALEDVPLGQKRRRLIKLVYALVHLCMAGGVGAVFFRMRNLSDQEHEPVPDPSKRSFDFAAAVCLAVTAGLRLVYWVFVYPHASCRVDSTCPVSALVWLGLQIALWLMTAALWPNPARHPLVAVHIFIFATVVFLWVQALAFLKTPLTDKFPDHTRVTRSDDVSLRLDSLRAVQDDSGESPFSILSRENSRSENSDNSSSSSDLTDSNPAATRKKKKKTEEKQERSRKKKMATLDKDDRTTTEKPAFRDVSLQQEYNEPNTARSEDDDEDSEIPPTSDPPNPRLHLRALAPQKEDSRASAVLPTNRRASQKELRGDKHIPPKKRKRLKKKQEQRRQVASSEDEDHDDERKGRLSAPQLVSQEAMDNMTKTNEAEILTQNSFSVLIDQD